MFTAGILHRWFRQVNYIQITLLFSSVKDGGLVAAATKQARLGRRVVFFNRSMC